MSGDTTQAHHIGRLVTLENGSNVRLKTVYDRFYYVAETVRKTEDGYIEFGRPQIVAAWETSDRNGYCPWHSGGEAQAKVCLNPHDHCEHGVYVGGCGVDWMCGQCEGGE